MGPDKMNHRTPTLIYASIQKGLEALMKAGISASSFTIVLKNGEPEEALYWLDNMWMWYALSFDNWRTQLSEALNLVDDLYIFMGKPEDYYEISFHSRRLWNAPTKQRKLGEWLFYIIHSKLSLDVRNRTYEELVTMPIQHLHLLEICKILEPQDLLVKIRELIELGQETNQMNEDPNFGFKQKIYPREVDDSGTAITTYASITEEIVKRISVYQKLLLDEDPEYERKDVPLYTYTTLMNLPLGEQHKHYICELFMMEGRDTFIVEAPTGTGKSLLIPLYLYLLQLKVKQYAYERAGLQGHTAHVLIIVIVPTRVAALTLADTVNRHILPLHPDWKNLKVTYGIGGDNFKINDTTNVAFCTVGIANLFAGKIYPTPMSNADGIVFDECHEMPLQSQILLEKLCHLMQPSAHTYARDFSETIRDILKKEHRRKLVLMSATINQPKMEAYLDQKLPKTSAYATGGLNEDARQYACQHINLCDLRLFTKRQHAQMIKGEPIRFNPDELEGPSDAPSGSDSFFDETCNNQRIYNFKEEQKLILADFEGDLDESFSDTDHETQYFEAARKHDLFAMKDANSRRIVEEAAQRLEEEEVAVMQAAIYVAEERNDDEDTIAPPPDSGPFYDEE